MIDDEHEPSRDERIRAFVALDLAPQVARALSEAAAGLKTLPWARDIRWVKEANLHLTLRFLGDIEVRRVAPLLRELERALCEVAPFSFELDGLAFFPSANRPRVLAVGVTNQSKISALAARVEDAIVAAGLPGEARGFRPHITLGRFRKPGRRGVDLEGRGPDGGRVDVRDVVLYHSRLDRSGAEHSELGRVELGASFR